jgi:ParB-like chromosome segregation protein Spo0J
MQAVPVEMESAEAALSRSWGESTEGVDAPAVAEPVIHLGPTVEVDPEFRKLIPLQSPDELNGLEASLLKDGCRDALVIWKGKAVLLDGHTRLALCTRLGIAYRVTEVDCTDRAAAKEWIIRNQLGRRNLTPFQRAELVMHLKPYYAAQARENLKTSTGGAEPQPSQKSGKAEPINTAAKMGDLAGMSHDTWAKAEFLTEQAPADVKEKLRQGETSINRAYLDLHHATRNSRKRKAVALPQSRRTVTDSRFCIPEYLRARLAAVTGAIGGDVPGDAIDALLEYIEGEGRDSWNEWVESRRSEAK